MNTPFNNLTAIPETSDLPDGAPIVQCDVLVIATDLDEFRAHAFAEDAAAAAAAFAGSDPA